MYIYKTKLNPKYFLENTDNPTAKKYIEEINTSCEGFIEKPIPSLKFSKFRLYDETGERAVFQQDYYERRRRMTMFLLKVWLYEKKDDIKELEDILWAVCDEYSWALPAHLSGILTDESIAPNRIDLFAAETAHTIAEALSLCGEHLHQAVKRRCIDEIFKRIFEPFESGNTTKYALGWEEAKNNWAAVCGGSVGMTALYLIEDEKRLMKIISRAKNACNNFFESCTNDGVCNEGMSYWMYAMQYYVAFDELLRERVGECVVENEEKMKKIAAFPAVACLTNGIIVRFSDCAETLLFFGILCKLNERYGVHIPEKGYYQHVMDRCARTAGAVRNVAWFNPSLLNQNVQTDDAFLPHGQWAILHNGTMTVATKGGHNDEPHNHNDIGSFMFVKDGIVLADELGAAKYTKAYFMRGERYKFLNAGSHGHSLPIVNGCTQEWGFDKRADNFEKTNEGISISFADAYGEKAKVKKLVRDLSLDENGVLIKDSFEFAGNSNSVTERIITKLDAKISGDNKVILTEKDTVKGEIELLTAGKVSISYDSYFVTNSSGRSDEYSPDDATQRVTIIECECMTDSDKLKVFYKIG